MTSTKAELVDVADALPKILWIRYFMENQEYLVEGAFVYQDSESAMFLETNGMKSIGKGSRHIKIKYFLVIDKIKDKEMRVLRCPTGGMTTDFYTKPIYSGGSILGLNPDHFPLYFKAHD